MKKIGLVLSGGGAQGAYQVGVWKALRKMHYKFDLVTGTSVGALNGIMVVQNDFRKCLKIWKNMSFEYIYSTSIDKNITTKSLYHKYAKEFVKNGGMDPNMLESLVHKMYNPKKFYKSPIDYGLVTFNLSTLKPKLLTKKKIEEYKLVDYAIASATCFPAFKVKKIDEEKFIDGGYYDNLPIELAVNMGADKIIAVDLNAIGIKRKINTMNKEITIIKPNNKLVNILDFNNEKINQALKYGYNDAMKKFGRLEGNIFTFKKNSLDKNYLNTYADFCKLLEKYKIINKVKTVNEYNTIIEKAGLLFEVDQTKIYSLRKFNKIIYKKLLATDKIESKNIKEILDKKRIVKTIYQQLDTKKKLDKIFTTVFMNETLIATYLKTIEKAIYF